MENSARFFENTDCRYYPCHTGVEELNCMFCYCPLYSAKNCLGNPKYIEKNGITIKDCTACTFPHQPDNYDKVLENIKNIFCQMKSQ